MRCGRTGSTKNGRPAFLKDNDTNHMLWFAHGADGPTWYVGKREEFGESRGWLQVKSDANTPQDIKGTWQVWSTTEKMWKNCKEGDIKCVSVSATCGVIIVGATPNNLLQDKLGEYRRVQLRVITGRGVYEMVGMPNVMMWYSPGGTWNIGKRDELGQNRGWYQAVSKAISPEGITNWQVWDGANKRWEKAPELQAISVGSRRIAFTGATPNDIGSDKLEEYGADPNPSPSSNPILNLGPNPSPSPDPSPSPSPDPTPTPNPRPGTCARGSSSATAAPCTSASTAPSAACGTRLRTGTLAPTRTSARPRAGSAARTTRRAPSTCAPSGASAWGIR